MDARDRSGAQGAAGKGGHKLAGTWADLTRLEEEMLAAAATGELVDLGRGPFNLAEMQAWPAERTVRAAVLGHLLVAGQWPVHAKGVRLRGVRISGHLSLEWAVLRCPLSLDFCYLDAAEPVCLDFATASLVMVSGCQLAGLTGEMLIARELDLSRSTFTGSVHLLVAEISGQVNCRGARLLGRDSEGSALNADRLKAGAVYLSEGFTAPGGAVRLVGADISGLLSCRGAQLTGTDDGGYALGADGMKAAGAVLDEGFIATGAVRLADVQLSGLLSCRGAQLTGADSDGNALVADRLRTVGGTFLDRGFTAAGAVRLLGADISGQLSCQGAQLTGSDINGNALVADWLKAASGVFLNEGFTAAGAVRFLGADITGHLECSGANLTGRDGEGNALVANGMKVDADVFLEEGFTAAGTIRLVGADITGALICRGARLTGPDSEGALVADRLKVGRGVFFDGAITAAGAVRLAGADITGQFSCLDAELAGHDNDGNALVADGIKVTGGAFFIRLTAAGTVRLLAADITAQLTCWGAKLTGRDSQGDALSADGMRVTGNVLLSEVSTTVGAIRLSGADISGPLVCSHAVLEGRDNAGNALAADRMKVGSSVSLDHGFTSAGAVRLVGADIMGQLTCRGAKLAGSDNNGDTLAADGMNVSDTAYFDGGFTATGTLSFVAARFGRSVEFKPAELASVDRTALVMTRAHISGSLLWAPAAKISGVVDLEGAVLGELADDWGGGRDSANGYWPVAGRLRLNGLTYERLGGYRQPSVQQRLEWVSSQYSQSRRRNAKATAVWSNGIMAPPVRASLPSVQSGSRNGRSFAPEPYEQLAKVYRKAGREGDARKIAVAKRIDERRYGDLGPYRKTANWFFDKTIKFGYQTWRAAVGLIVVFLAFLIMSILAQHYHGLVPINDLANGVHPIPVATRCTSSYPCFYPLGYAVDVVIPVIDLHQADFWGLYGWGWVVGSWLATALGWAAVTLLVVGYTGLVRQQ